MRSTDAFPIISSRGSTSDFAWWSSRAGAVENAIPTWRVDRKDPALSRGKEGAGVVTLDLEPLRIQPTRTVREQIRETGIEIRRETDRELVTSIELLSPASQEEPGFSDYLASRADRIDQPVHLVELELLVGGRRPPMDNPLPPGDYFAMVSRAEASPSSEVFAWSVRRALPVIPDPLSSPDPDVRLNPAEVFATTDRRGRWIRSIDYGRPLNAPLALEGRDWAEAPGRSPVA